MKMMLDSGFEDETRRDRAIDALDAVHDFCAQAAGNGNALDHVNANSLACLLDLIVEQLRGAQTVDNGTAPLKSRKVTQ